MENLNHMFGRNDQEKLKKLISQENRKREKELQTLTAVIRPDPLSTVMKNNVYTSCILPVLHTSIHAQKGIPHEIIAENDDFLKYTGINQLFIKLDDFVVQRQKSHIEEVERKLEDLQKRHDEENGCQEGSDETRSQDIDTTNEYSFLRKNEALYNKLKKEHEDIITDSVNVKLKDLLSGCANHAMERWAEIESKVTETGIFNPQYNGKHPAYKEKIRNILFGDLDEKLSPIFRELIDRLTNIFEQYKTKAIELFTEELHSQNESIVARIGRSLEFALDWHLGQRRSCLTEGTLKDSFEKSFNNILKEHILEPAYKESIATTKSKMRTQIQKVLSDVKSSFLKNILSLYNERWPKNLAKFMVRACIPLKSIHNPQPGCTFCGEIRCSICAYIDMTSTFSSSSTKKVYNIKERLSCISENVIYLITCKTCKKQYVGQTKQIMRRRFVDHLSRINCQKSMLVSQHFCMVGHSKQDISLVVIEQVHNNNISQRERYWIRELGTLTPNGLNANN
ncbi:uncharacterized protein O3C94_014103 [Discoglossus pictus]